MAFVVHTKFGYVLVQKVQIINSRYVPLYIVNGYESLKCTSPLMSPSNVRTCNIERLSLIWGPNKTSLFLSPTALIFLQLFIYNSIHLVIILLVTLLLNDSITLQVGT